MFWYKHYQLRFENHWTLPRLHQSRITSSSILFDLDRSCTIRYYFYEALVLCSLYNLRICGYKESETRLAQKWFTNRIWKHDRYNRIYTFAKAMKFPINITTWNPALENWEKIYQKMHVFLHNETDNVILKGTRITNLLKTCQIENAYICHKTQLQSAYYERVSVIRSQLRICTGDICIQPLFNLHCISLQMPRMHERECLIRKHIASVVILSLSLFLSPLFLLKAF